MWGGREKLAADFCTGCLVHNMTQNCILAWPKNVRPESEGGQRKEKVVVRDGKNCKT